MPGIDTTNINVSSNRLSFLTNITFVRCKKVKKVVLKYLRQNHEVYHSKSYNSRKKHQHKCSKVPLNGVPINVAIGKINPTPIF